MRERRDVFGLKPAFFWEKRRPTTAEAAASRPPAPSRKHRGRPRRRASSPAFPPASPPAGLGDAARSHELRLHLRLQIHLGGVMSLDRPARPGGRACERPGLAPRASSPAQRRRAVSGSFFAATRDRSPPARSPEGRAPYEASHSRGSRGTRAHSMFLMFCLGRRRCGSSRRRRTRDGDLRRRRRRPRPPKRAPAVRRGGGGPRARAEHRFPDAQGPRGLGRVRARGGQRAARLLFCRARVGGSYRSSGEALRRGQRPRRGARLLALLGGGGQPASSSSLARAGPSAAAEAFDAAAAASAAASEGVRCAELARPVRIAAHPLGGLGETVATAGARSPRRRPFSLDAAEVASADERISRTR